MISEQTPTECFIAGIEIKGLWGYRDVTVPFTREANILIGRNATGKTSIINILRYLLSLDIPSLLEITFDDATIVLQAYEGSSEHRLRATVGREVLKISLDEEIHELELPPHLRDPSIGELVEDFERARGYRRRRDVVFRNSGLRERLQAMVPAVWLPVNRGLSLRDEEAQFRPDRNVKVTSVEARLEVLLGELKTYRLALEARLSANYKEFEKKVLSLILFNKSYDNMFTLKLETFATADEKTQLINAFREARLLDERMQQRINDHFAAQDEALQRLKKQNASTKSPQGVQINLDDLFIMPLIRRTKEMIGFAREIEAEKKQIFSGLNKYTAIVSSFLHDKTIAVTDVGSMAIQFENPRAKNLTHHHLSSGEKQILILLTQALIYEGKSVVYVADEPELSLHVSWQEKLLDSLCELNPKMQLIIATHSPDIVGRRPVIDLERYLK